jgi:hypothetical protein
LPISPSAVAPEAGALGQGSATARILVIKLSALGDFIQATGPMKAIRTHHPDARITLLTTAPFEAVEALVAEQKDVLGRAAAIIEDREQPLPQGAYPIAFTAWHDIDLRHLAPRVIESLKRQAGEFASLAGAAGDATATELAGRAQEIARRHAEKLEGLLVRLRAGLAGQPA